MRPHRLLVISQVYVPDPASVGQHLADAAEEMVRRGWEVQVLTSARGYDDHRVKYPRKEERGGVAIRRLPLSSLGKQTILHRLGGQLSFCIQAILHGLFGRRPDLVLISTSPPMAGIVGVVLAVLRRVPMCWWAMDINPDQAVASGHARPGGLLTRFLEGLNRMVLRRAKRVVALDRFMAQRLTDKVPEAAERMVVIPPWPHESILGSGERMENPFRREQGFGDRFVVMYSGNHSMVHPLDTLLEAAVVLKEDPRFLFVFVGGGAGKKVVEDHIREGRSENVVSLPYQPLETLKYSLSAADLHAVSMGGNMVGIVHPCKLYGIMATGKPALCLTPAESHLGEILEACSCGWRIDHGDVSGTVDRLRDLVELPESALREVGARGQQAVVTTYGEAVLRGKFCELLESCIHD